MNKVENQYNSDVKKRRAKSDHHIGLLEKILERIEKDPWINFCGDTQKS